VFKEATCFADDYPKFKFDRLKMRVDQLTTHCFQGTEQPIAPLTISLTFGHSKFVLIDLRAAGYLKLIMCLHNASEQF
jgi:hypothetical protein